MCHIFLVVQLQFAFFRMSAIFCSKVKSVKWLNIFNRSFIERLFVVHYYLLRIIERFFFIHSHSFYLLQIFVSCTQFSFVCGSDRWMLELNWLRLLVSGSFDFKVEKEYEGNYFSKYYGFSVYKSNNGFL